MKKEKEKVDFDARTMDSLAMDSLAPEMMTVNMVDLVAKYFEKTEGKKSDMKALGVKGIGDAVVKLAEKDDKDALTSVVKKQMKKASHIQSSCPKRLRATLKPQTCDRSIVRASQPTTKKETLRAFIFKLQNSKMEGEILHFVHPFLRFSKLQMHAINKFVY